MDDAVKVYTIKHAYVDVNSRSSKPSQLNAIWEIRKVRLLYRWPTQKKDSFIKNQVKIHIWIHIWMAIVYRPGVYMDPGYISL